MPTSPSTAAGPTNLDRIRTPRVTAAAPHLLATTRSFGSLSACAGARPLRHRYGVRGRGQVPVTALPRAGGRLPRRCLPRRRADGAPDRSARPHHRSRAGRPRAGRPAIETILHAARQDVALLRRTWQTEVTRVFDTQVAAAFAGCAPRSATRPSCAQCWASGLRKSASFTKWDRRPLTEEQLGYAREDVLHLEEVAVRCRSASSSLAAWTGRSRSAPRSRRPPMSATPMCSLSASRRSPGRIPSPERWRDGLVMWREATAGSSDRPAQQVLGDQPLVELAKRRPRSLDDLRQIRGLGEANGRRRGEAIIEAIAAGSPMSRFPRRPVVHVDTRPEDVAVIALCEALLRTRQPQRILRTSCWPPAMSCSCSSRVTARALLPEESVRALQGWRREVVGGELLKLLSGELSLHAGVRGASGLIPAPPAKPQAGPRRRDARASSSTLVTPSRTRRNAVLADRLHPLSTCGRRDLIGAGVGDHQAADLVAHLKHLVEPDAPVVAGIRALGQPTAPCTFSVVPARRQAARRRPRAPPCSARRGDAPGAARRRSSRPRPP